MAARAQSGQPENAPVEFVMSRRVQDLSQQDSSQMDGATSAAVRRAIGERLRQTLHVNADDDVPPLLQTLLKELQRHDDPAKTYSR
jgi:hypothetical protein